MRFSLVVALCAIASCTSSNTTQLASNVIRIDTSAAPFCGPGGAQKMVTRVAAVETIRLGFDKYVIAAMDSQNNIRVVGSTQNTSGSFNTAGNTGGFNSTTNTFPVYGGSRDAAVVAVMFDEKDPSGRNAIDARRSLGPNWQDIVARGAPNTCLE